MRTHRERVAREGIDAAIHRWLPRLLPLVVIVALSSGGRLAGSSLARAVGSSVPHQITSRGESGRKRPVGGTYPKSTYNPLGALKPSPPPICTAPLLFAHLTPAQGRTLNIPPAKGSLGWLRALSAACRLSSRLASWLCPAPPLRKRGLGIEDRARWINHLHPTLRTGTPSSHPKRARCQGLGTSACWFGRRTLYTRESISPDGGCILVSLRIW